MVENSRGRCQSFTYFQRRRGEREKRASGLRSAFVRCVGLWKIQLAFTSIESVLVPTLLRLRHLLADLPDEAERGRDSGDDRTPPVARGRGLVGVRLGRGGG